jgi:hypothetical protein
MIFFPQDNSTQLSILEYLLFQMGVVDGISSIWKFCQISSCEILGSQKNYIFSRFLAVFLQINPKSKVTTMSSRRPQGPLTGIVQFDCNTFANTTKFGNSSPDYIWQILQVNLQSKSNLLRLRQLLFEVAPGDPSIGNFYVKKSLNIFYLSVLKYR